MTVGMIHPLLSVLRAPVLPTEAEIDVFPIICAVVRFTADMVERNDLPLINPAFEKLTVY